MRSQRLDRHIRGLDPSSPGRTGGLDLLVQALQDVELIDQEPICEGEKIDIADAWVEISRDGGACKVETEEAITEKLRQAIAEQSDDRSRFVGERKVVQCQHGRRQSWKRLIMLCRGNLLGRGACVLLRRF